MSHRPEDAGAAEPLFKSLAGNLREALEKLENEDVEGAKGLIHTAESTRAHLETVDFGTDRIGGTGRMDMAVMASAITLMVAMMWWLAWQWNGIDGLTVAAYSMGLICSAGSAWCGWRTAEYIPFKPSGYRDETGDGRSALLADAWLTEHEDNAARQWVGMMAKSEVAVLGCRLNLRRTAYALRSAALGWVGAITVARLAYGVPPVLGWPS